MNKRSATREAPRAPFADAGVRHLLVEAPSSRHEDSAGAMALVELADLVAHRVTERVLERVAPLLGLDSAAPEELVDAREIARRAGRSRWWVYEHAAELGAIKLGTGPNPRLAFSPARVQAYLAACTKPRDQQPAPVRVPPRRSRHTKHTPPGNELLTIRGSNA